MADALPQDNSTAASPAVRRYWQDFCTAVRLPADTPCQAWYFGSDAALAHELAELVLRGPKRATASLAEFKDGMPQVAPVPGGYSVVTEFDGTPRAVVRTARLDRRALRDVDAAFAWDEGEGDRTLADWQRGHRRYFTAVLKETGRAFDDGLLVDLERFELLYPFDAALNPVDCGPRLVAGLLPGVLSASVALQTLYYARDHAFGVHFETGRMADVAAFLARYDATRDGVWAVVDKGAILGTLVIDGGSFDDPDCAQLRWFILADELQGKGMGRRMMQAAMDFCAQRYSRVRLGTFSALNAARRLYEAFGFRKVHEQPTTEWGPEVLEQRWEWQRRDAR